MSTITNSPGWAARKESKTDIAPDIDTPVSRIL